MLMVAIRQSTALSRVSTRVQHTPRSDGGGRAAPRLEKAAEWRTRCGQAGMGTAFVRYNGMAQAAVARQQQQRPPGTKTSVRYEESFSHRQNALPTGSIKQRGQAAYQTPARQTAASTYSRVR